MQLRTTETEREIRTSQPFRVDGMTVVVGVRSAKDRGVEKQKTYKYRDCSEKPINWSSAHREAIK